MPNRGMDAVDIVGHARACAIVVHADFSEGGVWTQLSIVLLGAIKGIERIQVHHMKSGFQVVINALTVP